MNLTISGAGGGALITPGHSLWAKVLYKSFLDFALDLLDLLCFRPKTRSSVPPALNRVKRYFP